MEHVEKVVTKSVGKFTNTNREVSLNHELEADLGFDSLNTVELVMKLEQQLNIRIPDNFLHERLGRDWKKATVQQWIEAVHEKHK